MSNSFTIDENRKLQSSSPDPVWSAPPPLFMKRTPEVTFNNRYLKRIPNARIPQRERAKVEEATGYDWDTLEKGQFFKTDRFTLNAKFDFNTRILDKTRCHSLMWLKFSPQPYVARFKFLLVWSQIAPTPGNRAPPDEFHGFAARVRLFRCTEPRASSSRDTVGGNFMFVETDKTPANNPGAANGEFVSISKVKRAHPVLLAKMNQYGLPIRDSYYALCMNGNYDYEL